MHPDSKPLFTQYVWLLILVLSTPNSDTLAPSLVFLLYHIARYPVLAQKLRAELQTAKNSTDPNTLQGLPFLNAFIHESLRLFPTTPTGGNRETPPEGIQIAGRYIPGDTTIVAPAYHIGRRECRLKAGENLRESG
jgi:cytochrome P450